MRINRFEEGLGAQFETYAVQRIRGAMLDGLRENDWVPRGVRREMRRVEEAIHQLEHAAWPAAERRRTGRCAGHAAGRLPEAAAGRARPPAGLSGGPGRRSTTRLSRTQLSPARRPIRSAMLEDEDMRACAGARHRGPARARKDGHGPVLRRGSEPEGNRRGAGRHRIARLPVAQPGDRPPARRDADRRGGAVAQASGSAAEGAPRGG